MISQITAAGLRPARRARSTAASVWPVRSSTPPGLALSGKTWPGWTRSRGADAGSIGHGDRARAIRGGDAGRDALARLDRDGERGLEGRLVLGRHEVEAERLAALGREREADQAAALAGHEVDRVGRRELGRDREVALVLAVLVVADHDHPAVPDVLDRVLDRRERLAHRATSFSTYFATTSTSRLTGVPGAAAPERRALERLGDQRDGEGVAVDVDDGERDAVDGDRALLDDVAEQVGGRGDRDDAGEAVLLDRADRAEAVDVPLHDVAAEPVRGAQRELQVHVRARRHLGQRGAPQRLVHDLGAELLAGDRRGGEADAVDGHGVALGDLARQARADGQRHAVRRRVHRGDLAQVRDQAREHQLTTPASVRRSGRRLRSARRRAPARGSPRRCARRPRPPAGRARSSRRRRRAR